MADLVEVPDSLRLDRTAFRAWAEERAGELCDPPGLTITVEDIHEGSGL